MLLTIHSSISSLILRCWSSQKRSCSFTIIIWRVSVLHFLADIFMSLCWIGCKIPSIVRAFNLKRPQHITEFACDTFSCLHIYLLYITKWLTLDLLNNLTGVRQQLCFSWRDINRGTDTVYCILVHLNVFIKTLDPFVTAFLPGKLLSNIFSD